MQNIFQFLTYLIFGKRWIKWDMVQGLKMAIFVNEMEIDMNKTKLREAQERKEKLEADLKALEETPLKSAVDLLPESEKNDTKAIYDMEKKIKAERNEQVQTFKNQIKSANTDLEMADGELSRVYSITYSNRRKFDFVRNYKIKATYADLNK